jgi:hypothetical protein
MILFPLGSTTRFGYEHLKSEYILGHLTNYRQNVELWTFLKLLGYWLSRMSVDTLKIKK